MGGIAMRLPMKDWPHTPEVCWIVQADWEVSRSDVITLESLQMEFLDVLASCDLLLCKPGYGSFAEAACNGTPVLYVAREDWPEEPYLIAWLEAHGSCRRISRAQSRTGEFADDLLELVAQPRHHPVQPSGIAQAADYLFQLLR
jgi:UDP-N-acetylglucosamine:LPS N-acetylglucosamine transferase